MSTLLLRERRFLLLAVIMIVAVGGTTLLTIGRQEDPTITNLFATIVTPYPGASPARVESLVTEKIEEELETIAEIDTIESTSRTGISVIKVELSEFIGDTEIEQTWSEIRDALADAAVNLPPGVPKPEFDNDRTGAFTAISAVRARDGRDVPLAIMSRYAERLQDRLRSLPGTELVRIFGEPEEEILIEVDPGALEALGLEITAVSRSILEADTKIEAGRLRGGKEDFLIEIEGEIESLARVRRIPIASSGDGTVTRLGDVATVTRAPRTPASTLAFNDGDRAILIGARMEPDLQVDRWMDSVRQAMADFEETLPQGLVHEVLFDQSAYTFERLNELIGTLLMGVGLVVIVLIVTLGWRAALIVAVMLPLTSLASLAILQQLGVPIHQMSVTGLVVALGLLVDGAIVMVDEIRKRLASGLETLAAVGGSVRRLAMPLLASTLTTVLAFMPMAVLPGPAGDFVGSIATAVIVMLLVSLVLALTITPALAGLLILAEDKPGGWAFWRNGLTIGWLARGFRRSIGLSLRYPLLAVLAAIVLPVIGFGAFPTLTPQFFPLVDRDQFYVQIKLADGASIERTREVAQAAEAVLRDYPGIETIDWSIGESAPAFYYNMLMDQDGVATYAEALVTTANADATNRLIPELQERLDRDVPAAQIIVRDLVQGPPVAAPVELRLVGPDLAELRRLGNEARTLMAGVPEVTHTKASLMGGAAKLVFELDEDRVRLAGLQLADVARQLDAALEGVTGGSLIEGTEELSVRVRLESASRSAAERIASLDILPPDAKALVGAGGYPGIPLMALGTLRLSPSESPISRRNGERINNVQAYIEIGLLPEAAFTEVREQLAQEPLSLPSGYRIEWGGDSDARDQTINNLMSSMGLIMAGLVITIVVTFNSYRLAGVAAVVCVLSMGLSILSLAVFGYPFGVQALIGVIGSIGVSINAAIIIMTALQADDRAMLGDIEAMTDVVTDASRHIVSTTVTTFGGFLPLILAGGGFWPPFAMAIAGGVLLSSIVSFYFVPPMFRLVMARRVRRQAVSRPSAVSLVHPRPEAA